MSRGEPSSDVIVVGASLAGATAALSLAASGLSVTLVDKAGFPRSKPCGEGLSRSGAEVVERLGLGAELASLPHSSIHGFRIWGAGATEPLELRWTRPKAFGVRRFHLDDLLVTRCRETPGIRMLEGRSAQAVEESHECCEVSLDGAERSRGRFVVLACGGHSPIVNRLARRPGRYRGARFGASLLTSRSGDSPMDCVTIVRWNGAEIYCTPLSGRETNIAVLGTRETIRHVSRPEGLARMLTEAGSRLGAELEPLLRLRGAGPFAWPARPAYLGRVLLCGDSAETLDPIGGMGMTHALLTGAAAARRLAEAVHATDGVKRSLDAYARDRERIARPLRALTALSHTLVRLSHGAVPRALARHRFATELADSVENGGEGSGLARLLSRAAIDLMS